MIEIFSHLFRRKNQGAGLPHEHAWRPIRRGYPQVMCKCGVIGVRGVKSGENTISVGVPGTGDIVRWSGSAAPVALGDLGMDTTTGRLQQFVGGVAEAVANLVDITAGAFNALMFDVGASGVTSTGALAFTPKAVFHEGSYAFVESGISRVGSVSGVGRGTAAADQRGNGFNGSQSGGSVLSVFTLGGNGNIGQVRNTGGATNTLTVTAFAATGVDVTWDSSTAGTGYSGRILVVG